MAARHRARRRWATPVIALVLGAVAAVAAGAALVLREDGDKDAPRVAAEGSSAAAPCPTTVEVVAASSYVPVLQGMATALETGEDCAQLDITAADGRAAPPLVVERAAHVWIPDDAAWAGVAEDVELAPEGALSGGTVVAESPLYFVADAGTAERVRAAGGGWRTMADLLRTQSGVRLAVRDPGGSGEGMLGAGAVGEAVWIAEGMDASAEALATAMPQIRTVDTTAMPAEPGEVGVVAEYALVPDLGSAALQGMEVIAPVDHTALLRYCWLPTAAAAADPSLAGPLARVLATLTGPEAGEALAANGLRARGAPAPPGDAATALPPTTAAPYEVLGGHHVDHVFATWYAQDRRSDVLVAVDVSGSMAEVAPGSDRPLIDLVREGVLALAGQLPDEAELALWQFGSQLDGPRDYVSLLGRAPLTEAQRQALGGAVGGMQATETGTGLYDTMLAAYLAGRDAARPGVPTLVVVFTDGRNEDDPGSISIEDLTAQLVAAQDPARPVQLTVAAFGEETDAELLTAALKPVNGYVDPLDSAEDVRAMFLHVAAGGIHS